MYYLTGMGNNATLQANKNSASYSWFLWFILTYNIESLYIFEFYYKYYQLQIKSSSNFYQLNNKTHWRMLLKLHILGHQGAHHIGCCFDGQPKTTTLRYLPCGQNDPGISCQ